jgi:predicted  nucleic acid-binding Zn-ribbon protein
MVYSTVLHPELLVVSQSETLTLQQLQAETLYFKDELQARDQLVQQLSQELFRLVKGQSGKADASSGTPIERDLAEMRALREQMRGMEEQVNFYQDQIADRDVKISTLEESMQGLNDRSQMLEKVVQELPNVYRQKFAERMAPVKEKVVQIQQENRKLHAELQSVSYRLAMRSRQAGQLDLPSFAE